VATAPEALRKANQTSFTRPLRRDGARLRYLDARWWSLPVGGSVKAHIATTQSWLDLWARRHLTDRGWRGLTGADALLHLTLVAAWDAGVVARITPHPQAQHTALWRAATGLVDTPNRPIGVVLLDAWNPGSAHGRMAAMSAIPDWAWDGPPGVLLAPPVGTNKAFGKTKPHIFY
jgi:hypothetical protein